MRRITHTLFALATALTALLGLASCATEGYDNSPRGPLELSHTRIVVGRKAQVVTVGVTARQGAWSLRGSQPWCAADRDSGQPGTSAVTVTFSGNDGSEARTTTLVFSAGGEERSIPVEQLNVDIVPDGHRDASVNKVIHDRLALWYYNGEAADVIPDPNQQWDDFYENYLGHLSRNDHDGNYWAQDNERYLYSRIERRPTGSSATPLNYGMEFELGLVGGTLAGRVLYVEEGSPAYAARLKRGDWFNRVNGVRLATGTTSVGDFRYYYNRVIDSLVHPVEGRSPTLGMMTYSGASQLLTESSRTVTLTPRRFVGSPVFRAQAFTLARLDGSTARVGYMMYNRFDGAYTRELEAAFAEFSRGIGGEALDSFILDVRYNSSGSVETAHLLGNLLAGNLEGAAGKTFAEYIFHENAPRENSTALFEPHAGGIAPQTVYVLTSRHTAGAAELLINALRGLDRNVLRLVVIGEVTQGMAAGMVETGHTADGYDYRAWMLAFRPQNAAGAGGYIYGLVPNGGEVDEWQRGENLKWSDQWGWKGAYGATEDRMVQRAVDMIKGSVATPAGAVVNASQRKRAGYPRDYCFPPTMTMDAAATTQR